MVTGVGTDIVKIEKIKNAVERLGDDFLNRVFNKAELEMLDRTSKVFFQRVAARFAAKEAVIKALTDTTIALKDIMILTYPNGAPYCKLSFDLKKDVLISISHIEDYAVAFAVAEKKP